MLSQARANAGSIADKINYMKMDAQNLKFDDEMFDVIVTRNLTWNLPEPDKAYEQWCRVLKKGGLMLNFDANWYGYLYDDDIRQKYERDRENVKCAGVKDEYTCTDIDAMEEIALSIPLSSIQRPQWDVSVLEGMCSCVDVDTGAWRQLWSEEEKLNFASTPLFSVQVIK
jgi:SAM-dependent methyltransferase